MTPPPAPDAAAAIEPSAPAPAPPAADADANLTGESPDPSLEYVDQFRRRIDSLAFHADELERKVNGVEEFYAGRKQSGSSKAREKERAARNNASSSAGNVGRRDACSKRMQDLMRQFGTILRQISQHKWASPFMEPVDVEGLGLDDYYEIIKKPMDLSTIRYRMEAKDSSGYKSVREIYADVRLVFTNAMTYNDDKNAFHVMAKTLLEKFEEKWLQLLPKIIEEETRQKEEEAMAQADMFVARESSIRKMARDTSNELNELNSHLDELREMVVQKCRKMSTAEKKRLGTGLSSLSPEDINKALEIIAQSNPNFQAMSEEVNLDMDEQSETTLWRLKFFVKRALEVQDLQAKNSTSKADENTKRKKVICDALAKTAKKRNKIMP